ncbi:TPA: hypothetical protein HA259_07665 [Thermoplasmata archaeon]|nr:hypothetical protein [Thermoplasmata archaeon]
MYVGRLKRGRELRAAPVVVAALVAVGMLGVCVQLKSSAVTNVLLMEIDIGNPESEALAVSMPGWGPIEPDTHGGNWGGYGASGEDTRVIWFADDERWAMLQLGFVGSGRTMEFKSLDGTADDSFKVYMLVEGWSTLYGTYDPLEVPSDAWVEVYSYTADPNVAEVWIDHSVDISPSAIQGVARGGCEFVVIFEATGDPWSLFNTFGQVAIDHFKVLGNGQPMVVE